MRVGACLVALLLTSTAAAQMPGTGYHRAPDAIAKTLEMPPTPNVAVSPDHRTLAVLDRENLPTIANLSKPILRLGGYRIDPATNGQAEVRVQWLNGLSFKDVGTGRTIRVALPAGTRFASPDWSPNGTRLAFYAQGADGLSLWVAERDGTARTIAKGLNGTFATPFVWTPDSQALIVNTIPAGRGAAPAAAAAPTGPIVQESAGRTSAARTYEDLIRTPADEALFDHYFTGQLARIDLASGAATDRKSVV